MAAKAQRMRHSPWVHNGPSLSTRQLIQAQDLLPVMSSCLCIRATFSLTWCTNCTRDALCSPAAVLFLLLVMVLTISTYWLAFLFLLSSLLPSVCRSFLLSSFPSSCLSSFPSLSLFYYAAPQIVLSKQGARVLTAQQDATVNEVTYDEMPNEKYKQSNSSAAAASKNKLMNTEVMYAIQHIFRAILGMIMMLLFRIFCNPCLVLIAVHAED